MIIISESEEITEKAGELLSKSLAAGDVVTIDGGLGAGKTVFTRGLARGLGYDGRVTSPTFAILNIYEGKIKIYHFDMYRITSPEMLFDIGFEEYVGTDGVCVIEWGKNVGSAVPFDAVSVNIVRIDDQRRKITISRGRFIENSGF